MWRVWPVTASDDWCKMWEPKEEEDTYTLDATKISLENWEGFKRVRKRPVVVHAVQLHEPFYVDTKEGRMTGKAGDWLKVSH